MIFNKHQRELREAYRQGFLRAAEKIHERAIDLAKERAKKEAKAKGQEITSLPETLCEPNGSDFERACDEIYRHHDEILEPWCQDLNQPDTPPQLPDVDPLHDFPSSDVVPIIHTPQRRTP
jgi:hypothetical protein